MTPSSDLKGFPPTPTSAAPMTWSADAALAYAILRLTFGINIGVRGLGRIFGGADGFAAGLAERFEPTILPGAAVIGFGSVLPWLEAAVGLLLIAGLWTRPALIVGGITLSVLTFGVMLVQDFQTAWLQLTYALVYFILLAARSWNLISVDGWRERASRGG